MGIIMGKAAELALGERRIVTVLFADIVNSTERIAELDPEDAQDFLDNVLHRMIEHVHAHGGLVAQTLGDGLMAVFGAMGAREDHALAACRAGIAIRDDPEGPRRGKGPVSVRIGIHSGPAVMRWGGNDFGRELKSVGATAHLAARIEKLCPENGVAISSVTLALAARSVDTSPLMPLRGQGYDLEVLELAGLGSEGAEPRIRGRAPNRLAGRQSELGEINAVVRAVQDGAADSIAIVGEAGLGKSRLVHEVELRAVRANISCETIRALASNTATPFAPWRPLASRLLRQEGLSGEEGVHRLMQQLGLSRRESLGFLSLAGRALDEDEEWRALQGRERKRAIVGGFLRALMEHAEQGPFLLIVEDLHFFDSESLGLLKRLAAAQASKPFALVATARPERMNFAVGIVNRILELSPLDPAAARKLAASELEASGAVEADRQGAMIDAIVSRAGGIPLAIEEFARMLSAARAEHGFSQSMPISVENAFHARLRQLSMPARALAEAASVLGGDFEISLLAKAAPLREDEFEGALGELVEQRFLETADGATARFAHQLMEETCYAFTARGTRRALHLAAHAAMLEAPEARRLNQELARHALGGEEIAQGLKHLWDACVEAIGEASLHSVVALYRQARAVCADAGPAAELEQAKFALLVFDAFQQLGEQEELVAALEAAKAALTKAGARRGAVQAEIHLAMAHWIGGRHKLGLECAERALAEAEGPLQTYGEFTLANLEFADGQALKATARLRALIKALSGELATTRFGASISIPGAMARAFASWYLCYVGAFEEAERYQRELAESAQALDHQYSHILAMTALGYIRLRRETYDAAIETLSVAHELCWSGDYHGLEPCISAWYALALIERGRLAQAQAVVRRSLQHGNHEKIRNCNRYYIREAEARLHASLGEYEAALAVIEEALQVALGNEDPIHTAYGRLAKAEILLKKGGDDVRERARADIEAALAVARERGMTPLEAEAGQALAQI